MKRLAPALRGIGIEYEDARLPGNDRKRAKRLRKNNGAKDRPHRPDRPANQETPAKLGDKCGTMMAEVGRSRADGSSRTVPDETPANERLRDDGDGRDDDLQADSSLSDFLGDPPTWYTKQAEECGRRGTPERLLKPLASAVAYEVFGDTNRWSEVLPLVEAALRSEVRR
jgi:hypothetical protein